MPMSLKEQIHLLSMVDILGPLSDEELEDLAKRGPPIPISKKETSSTPPRKVRRGFSSSRSAGCRSTR